MNEQDIISYINKTIKSLTNQQLMVTFIVVIFIYLFKLLISMILEKKIHDAKKLYKIKKALSMGFYVVVIFAIGKIWVDGFVQVVAFLSAGLAIALREPITDICGWFFIIGRRTFEVGDRIEIGGHAGDVIDIRMFQFTIMEIGNWVNSDQSTGRMIHIPNGKIFTESLANYNRGFKYIWNEIEVMVTFESNWKSAKNILQNIANKRAEQLSKEARENLKAVSKKYMINYSKLTPIVYTKAKDSGVLLTIRYLCKPQNRRTSECLIWEDILVGFNGHEDIELAYPTQRITMHK